MLDPEKVATIRRLYFAERWKIGTIAFELGVHRDAVRAAVETDPLHRPRRLRPSRLDPYLPFLRETLERHPRLRATRLLEMIRQRGYVGSIQRLRCVVARLRPTTGEPFLRLVTLPGEQAQVDWAHFGEVMVGRAKRRLSCFVMTLSFSRALFLEFFFDQSQENFFRGHVAAFDFFSGVSRVILYDNLKSAVLERQGSAIHFHPRLIELCSHYHFQPRPCAPGKGNQKGKVERAIRYVRESFFEGTRFTTLEDLNRRAWAWRDQVAHQRPGRTTRNGRWRRSSQKRSRGCFRCPCIPSRPSCCVRCGSSRGSGSPSTSTTTRFRPTRWGGSSRSWPQRSRCASWTAKSRSSLTAAPTTATSTSTRPVTRRPCSSTSAKREDRRRPAASPPLCPRLKPS